MLKIEIVQLDCRHDNPQAPQCVEVVHYRFSKEANGHTACAYGTKSLGAPDHSRYTMFPDLTKEQVVQWLGMDLVEVEASLDSQLKAMANPPIVSHNPPWV